MHVAKLLELVQRAEWAELLMLVKFANTMDLAELVEVVKEIE